MRDKKEFEQYYLMYANKIYSVAYRMVNNHEDAVDIVQEVFIRAFKNLNNFKGLSKFSTYLYRITVNLSYDFLRKKAKIKKIENLNDKMLVNNHDKLNLEYNLYEEDLVNEI
ncbi:MAG: sigma-70 family RNA polymerase sigma factor, partial [bacterium]|nr:sigma-70 family RNA polymerase sigma factor [bacterium]